MITILLVLLLIVLLFFSAMMSGSETSLFSLSSVKVRTYSHSQDKRKQAIADLLKRPRELLVTLLMLNVFSNILVQNTVSTLFGTHSSWLIKVGLPLFLTLFFGEVIPKSLALPNNVRIAYFVTPFVRRMENILSPIRKPLTLFTSYISRVLFFFLKKEKPLSSEELEHIVFTSKEEGVLTKDESEIISGYLDLKDVSVKERMTPKNEVLFYDISKPLEDLISLFVEQRVSRIPVCQEELNNLLGIISSKSFFLHEHQIHSPDQLISYLQKPFFVPENTKGWKVLGELRKKSESLAVAVDEYGSINGIITQEDLIESVIGEIEDARDVKTHFTRSTEDVVIASGKMTLEEFEDLFHEKLLSATNVVTLGGWLTEQLGDIPPAGAKYSYKDFLFYILASEPNRIKRIYIRKKKHKRKIRHD